MKAANLKDYTLCITFWKIQSYGDGQKTRGCHGPTGSAEEVEGSGTAGDDMVLLLVFVLTHRVYVNLNIYLNQ